MVDGRIEDKEGKVRNGKSRTQEQIRSHSMWKGAVDEWLRKLQGSNFQSLLISK